MPIIVLKLYLVFVKLHMPLVCFHCKANYKDFTSQSLASTLGYDIRVFRKPLVTGKLWFSSCFFTQFGDERKPTKHQQIVSILGREPMKYTKPLRKLMSRGSQTEGFAAPW